MGRQALYLPAITLVLYEIKLKVKGMIISALQGWEFAEDKSNAGL